VNYRFQRHARGEHYGLAVAFYPSFYYQETMNHD